MTTEFSDMMYLMACGARGIIPEKKAYSGFAGVIECASRQGVRELVISAILKGIEEETIDSGKIKVNDLSVHLSMCVSKSLKRFYSVYSLIDEIEKKGICCCTLKGLTNAVLYKDMLLRVSSDVDILINEKDEEKILEILREKGFTYEPRHKTYNETVCKHPSYGVLEVHISPYDDIREEILFHGKGMLNEEYYKLDVPGYFKITALGITDGLIFNVLHCIKHFLSSGVGIRQIMDILLYMRAHRDEIDWTRFNALMRELKYTKFIGSCIKIGIDHLLFSASDFPYAEKEESEPGKLLEDIENGGVFGLDDVERTKFYKRYVNAMADSYNQKKLVGDSYIDSYESSVMMKLFPNKMVLYQKYPYCFKFKFLLPVAWLQRLFTYVFVKRKSTAPVKSKVDERMKLVKELGMM